MYCILESAEKMKTFTEEHKRLYNEAKMVSNDYGQVTTHYYSVMAKVIEEYFNGNFHFVPPPKCADKNGRRRQKAQYKIKLEEALSVLHQRIGQCLRLEQGKHCLDIGCGIGGVIEDLAITQATFTGLTISPEEVEMGNANFQKQSISSTCRIVQADCLQGIPVETASQDAAYAIYSLKYFPDLQPIIEEVARVLKPGGLFLIYDLVKTSKYDKSNEEHRKLLDGLEFACGMPCLHSRQDLVDSMMDFDLVESVDLSAESGHPFYYCFNSSTLFMWLVRSPIVKHLVKIGQFCVSYLQASTFSTKSSSQAPSTK
uniref:SAM-dependent methyltransferase Erg6/SMT-type domain-containing protein n=1 Tax=Ditylenchus dipsaci TaxID=166011 RepID=A0A915CSD4_9BILA